MATAAFRSTTKRSDTGGGGTDAAGSSNRHRRSRSLNRYSDRFPPPPPAESDEFSTPRGRFVNKTRGSGFPDISLDDLANEFFGAKEEEENEIRSGQTGRSCRRGDDVSFRMETESSRRRGRSVSRATGEGKGVYDNDGGGLRQRRSVSVARHRCSDLEDENNIYHGASRHHNQLAGEGKGLYGTDSSSRQRRSVSVSRYRCSDVENVMDKSHSSSSQTKLRSFANGNLHQPSSNKQMGHALRRSMSHKDLFHSHDNYSSHSSSLTDDEAQDARSCKSGSEKTIRAVYALEKTDHPTGDDGEGTGLYEAMRKEVRHAVKEIKTELEKVMVKTDPIVIENGDNNKPNISNVINVISEIRRNYTTKLGQSEKRKQDLLAELAAEEQRGQELTNIVRELLPAPKQIASPERPSRSRRRSTDRTRMSKCLIEEAERYFEDFLSNVEDTDISSFDGERSDTSSTLGGSTKLGEPAMHNAVSETHVILAKAASLPAETDGVLLPWLQWETTTDASPSPCKNKGRVPVVSGIAEQEAKAACDNSTNLSSSLGSWSPEGNDSSSAVSSGVIGKRFGEVGSHLMSSSCFSGACGGKGLSFDMDEYLQLQRGEDLLFERFRQRNRIESGSLILCGRTLI